MQARFAEISGLTDTFCHEYLNDEWKQLCRELTATLARKRPSPLMTGKVPTWAAGIVHALAFVNFLFDPSQKPNLKSNQISDYFKLGQSTVSAKSKQIRDLFQMHHFDPDWTAPSKMGDNPYVWILSVNGLMVDIRYVEREIQEVAFQQGLIPYIPADQPDEDE